MGNGTISKISSLHSRPKDFQSVLPLSTTDNANDKCASPIVLSSEGSSKNLVRTISGRTAPLPLYSDMPLNTEFPSESENTLQLTGNASNKSDLSRSDSSRLENSAIESSSFDFQLTEGQIRRGRMADCETECSQITRDIYVGGYYVAGKLDILKANNITRIVNCSSAVVENHFIGIEGMKYLSLNMVDGRQDDISWFLCEVIQFIISAKKAGERILIHCEKGVSRSCSFVIAYRLWATGCKWKEAFDFVKERRAVCAPNTAFTCNLIEIAEIFSGNIASINILFRCAYHLPHDPATPVLKLCRNNESRKVLTPRMSLLDPRGVFLIRALRDASTVANESQQAHYLFMWCGREATPTTISIAEKLGHSMFGVLTRSDVVTKVVQGEETQEFFEFVSNDGPFSAEVWQDYYDIRPLTSEALVDLPVASRNFEANVNEIVERRRPSMVLSTPQVSQKLVLSDGTNNSAKNSRSNSRRLVTEDLSSEARVKKQSEIPPVNVEMAILAAQGPDDAATLNKAVTATTGSVLSSSSSSIDRNSPRSTRIDLSVVSAKSSIESDGPSNSTAAMKSSLLLALPVRKDEVVPSNGSLSTQGTSRDSEIDIEINTSRTSNAKSAAHASVAAASETRSAKPSNSFSLSLPVESSSSAPPTMLTESERPPLSRTSSSKSALLTNRSKESLRESSPCPPAYEIIMGKPISVSTIKGLPKLSAEQPDHPNESECLSNLIPSGSKNKIGLLSLAGAGIASISSGSRPASSERRTMFNSTRIAPQPIPTIDKSPTDIDEKNHSRRNSTTSSNTNTTGETPVLLPLSRNNSSNNSGRFGLPEFNSPTSQPLNRSASKEESPLALPIKALHSGRLTPNSDRLPEHIGLSRGPTPVEELTPGGSRIKRDQESRSEDHYNMKKKRSDSRLPPTVSKPTLFQALLSENSSSSSSGSSSGGGGKKSFEWQAMGVYDEEDLIETSVLLLLSQHGKHFIWIGCDVEIDGKSVHEDDTVTDDFLLHWAADVAIGEVKFGNLVGKYLLTADVRVERAGSESDEFWSIFNEGC